MLYQKYYLCFLLSLPKDDSANSERSEEFISFRHKMQIQDKGLFQNINWSLHSLRETIF